MMADMLIERIPIRFVLIISIAGLNTKMYGMMNAPMASFVAFKAVFIGFPFAMAAPAKAARATGGVTSAMIPK